MAGSTATAPGGPGGSAFAWGRDERLADFAQGWPGDAAKPTPWQLMILSDLCGPDGACPGATDDEVLGLVGQWDKAESWLVARKLAVLRELASRYPASEDARDDQLAREVSLRLNVSMPAARKLIDFSAALGDRLPRIGKALDEGLLDPGEARMACEETSVLDDPGQLARAEEIILAGLPECPTWAALQRLAQKAVCTVDPEGARKRREKEERDNARVRFWREAAGTCALMGAGLPTDEALAAHAHVETRAHEYRAAGVKRPIEILRVAAYLDLLNGVPVESRVARFAAEDASQAAAGAAKNAAAGDGAGDSGPEGGPWDNAPACGGCNDIDCSCSAWPTEAPCQHCTYAPCRCGADGETGGDGTGPDGGGSGAGTPGRPGSGSGSTLDPGTSFAGSVNLTLAEMDIPLLTAFGLGWRPGDARSLGTLDPALARKLAEAAARNPASTFCLTIVNGQGHAIGHGCLKPARTRKKMATRPPGGFTITPRDRAGPPGGYGSWTMSLPGRAGTWTVDLHPAPTGE